LLVGGREICEDYQSKVTMVRDLPEHIEYEPKLLSFTAWYAISKNKLYSEYEHVCILEWDVILDPDFLPQLQELSTPMVDAISFVEVDFSFLMDISIHTAECYLKNKGIIYPFKNRIWGCSTNQCMRRTLLDEFVDWYYPSCLQIKEMDFISFSWYHERMYMIFLDTRSIRYQVGKGLKHLFSDSHKDINIRSLV